ncbi:MAG: DegT/DnrJ/EryC1/StrS family aminotransferase [Tannerella sp.]|jgi:dTDP-4-amino-4,6-dideoxygalactose transaminase|nr:DegT/DnrJ/EryC1/StrS family aminotransferase [Tannerella sp.]
MEIYFQNDKPALLGGQKVMTERFPSWPIYDGTEEQGLFDVLHSGRWGRLDGKFTALFEDEYAKLMGMKHALATSGGTTALISMLGALDIGPGDEVLMPAYTFVATYNVVVLNYALPILIDTDMESFQIDPRKMEKAITKETKALMPVHMGGVPADLDRIIAIAQKHRLPVIEDCCQAPGSEWKGKKVGSYGVGGAFSFQSSKNLNCAEGGAVTTNDSNFDRACRAFHHQGQTRNTASFATGEGVRGTNARMTEWQSRILLAQMTRFSEQDRQRTENAYYLNSLFMDIPGIYPAKLYPGTTNVSYHLYMFRYDKTHFKGMSRERFIQALRAEGISTGTGYGRLNSDPYVLGLTQNKYYLKIYGEKMMKQWVERNRCPINDKLTSEQSLWLSQSVLLGSRQDMDKIAEAILKIKKYAKELIDSE